jgi:hypothetical protein
MSDVIKTHSAEWFNDAFTCPVTKKPEPVRAFWCLPPAPFFGYLHRSSARIMLATS